jgi:hypothetical protein
MWFVKGRGRLGGRVRGKRQKVSFFWGENTLKDGKSEQNESVFRSSKIKLVFVVIGPI